MKFEKPTSGCLEPVLCNNIAYLYNRKSITNEKSDIRNDILYYLSDIAELVECVHTIVPNNTDKYKIAHMGAFFELFVHKFGVDFVVEAISDYSEIRYVSTDVRSEVLWMMSITLEAVRQNEIAESAVEIIGYLCCISKMLGFEAKTLISEYRRTAEHKDHCEEKYLPQENVHIGLRALFRRVFSGKKK